MAGNKYWKSGRKIDHPYENKQYEGGRKKNIKNLVKTETGYINQKGVAITFEERKRLESLVNSINKKRKKMLEVEAKMPRRVGGRDTGNTVGELHLMGEESELILSRRSKSIQRFDSRKDFEKYMKSLERANSRDYVAERLRMYKRNYIKAVENEFGHDGRDIMMRIRMMKPDQFKEIVQTSEEITFGFIYGPIEALIRANRIRVALGMNTKDYFEEEFFEEL